MLTLFVYRYFSPVYHQWVTLDCAAATRELALRSAQRFLQRENRRLAKAGPRRCPVPRHVNHMHVSGISG